MKRFLVPLAALCLLGAPACAQTPFNIPNITTVGNPNPNAIILGPKVTAIQSIYTDSRGLGYTVTPWNGALIPLASIQGGRVVAGTPLFRLQGGQLFPIGTAPSGGLVGPVNPNISPAFLDTNGNAYANHNGRVVPMARIRPDGSLTPGTPLYQYNGLINGGFLQQTGITP